MNILNQIHRVSWALLRRARTLRVLACLLVRRCTDVSSTLLIATPAHGNLGDHAIVVAEKRFLEDMGLGDGVFEIQRYQYELACNAITRLSRPGDLVVIDGGGNVGTLWPEENDKMNDIVRRFSGNPVVIFPQTAFFEDTSAGRECRQRVGEAYAENPSLLFLSRDRVTYETMREIAPGTRNLYVPDIVLYLDESRRGLVRSGALLCLRNDKERVVDDGITGTLRTLLETRGFAVQKTDTVVASPSHIDSSNRDAALRAKWDEFASVQVVVTDRLHGMLFSAITGTPCVALDNVSHKVSQGYEWIRDIPNICVADSLADVPALLDEVLLAGPLFYDRSRLESYWQKVRGEIRALL